jgi:hypothetical protein
MDGIKKRISNLDNPKLQNQIYAAKEFIRALPRPLLVYQMSKVGSTSVYKSLRNAGLAPLHVHKIAGYRQYSTSEYVRDHGVAPTIDFYVGKLLYPYLRWTFHSIKVISLVRDPVARYLSMLYHWNEHSAGASSVVSSDHQQTEQSLVEHLSQPSTFEEGMFKWFDREIKTVLEVDVMREPFDKERGAGQFSGPRADVLVLKLERLSDLLPTVVSDFVGTPVQEVQANVGYRRSSGDQYERMKRSLHLPKSVVHRIYSHNWVQHFYTSEEIAALKARWT